MDENTGTHDHLDREQAGRQYCYISTRTTEFSTSVILAFNTEKEARSLYDNNPHLASADLRRVDLGLCPIVVSFVRDENSRKRHDAAIEHLKKLPLEEVERLVQEAEARLPKQ